MLTPCKNTTVIFHSCIRQVLGCVLNERKKAYKQNQILQLHDRPTSVAVSRRFTPHDARLSNETCAQDICSLVKRRHYYSWF